MNRLLAVALSAFLAVPVAWAQGVSEQPLPPPGGAMPEPGIPASPQRTAPVLKPPAHPLRRPAGRPHAATAKRPAARAPKPAPKKAAPVKAEAAAPTAPPPQPAPKIDPTKGTSTGLSLPRWVSFRSDDVNLRAGPGTQYPIDWVYHRRDYPVQVLREFEVWRLVQIQDGTKGWVHQATITGRRGFVVQTAEQVLRAGPADTADPVAKLESGVIGHIKRCPAGSAWCEVQAGDYGGWLKRDAMYGVSADEAIP